MEHTYPKVDLIQEHLCNHKAEGDLQLNFLEILKSAFCICQKSLISLTFIHTQYCCDFPGVCTHFFKITYRLQNQSSVKMHREVPSSQFHHQLTSKTLCHQLSMRQLKYSNAYAEASGMHHVVNSRSTTPRPSVCWDKNCTIKKGQKDISCTIKLHGNTAPPSSTAWLINSQHLTE